jgi:hypothetical protein
MQSDQPDSELDDEAIKMLFEYAGWDCYQDREDQEWYIKPPRASSPYCSFTTLQKALNYFLLYKRVWEKHE